MKQVKISNISIRSHLIWNKPKTAVALKEGDKLIKMTSHPNWLNPNFPDIAYLATYNTKNELKFLAPWSGPFKAKFVGFWAEKDKQPEPKVRMGKFGEVA